MQTHKPIRQNAVVEGKGLSANLHKVLGEVAELVRNLMSGLGSERRKGDLFRCRNNNAATG